MLKFLLNATEYYANNSVLSVESIRLMTIIFGKMGQKCKKVKKPRFFAVGWHLKSKLNLG